MRTAIRMIAVVERPLLPSSVLPPSVVTVEEETVRLPKLAPWLTVFLMLFSIVVASFDPEAAVEVIAISTITEPFLIERTAISLI